MGYIFLISVSVYLILAFPVNAVTTSISNVPESIGSDPFTLEVTVSGASVGTNYLKVDLYRPSSTNYFGETFNGLSWYSDSDPTQYYSINVESSKDWNGNIQAKVGNPNITQYEGPGIYKLRIRRYTSSGNYNSAEANNSAIDVNLNLPLDINPTPINLPSPTLEINEQSITPTTIPQAYNNLFLSEAMIDPETGSGEWIELFNANIYEVVLKDWFVDDTENSGSTPKKFSLTIPANSYLSLDLTGSMFNNGGDSVRLLNSNQQEMDSFEYVTSEKSKTLGRISFADDNFCLQNPTKNNSNNSCLNPSPPINKDSPTATIAVTITTALETPVNSSVSSLISTPFKFPLLQPNSVSQKTDDNGTEVLGTNIENTAIKSVKNSALISSLTFASFSYSLLSIISILFKVKNNF